MGCEYTRVLRISTYESDCAYALGNDADACALLGQWERPQHPQQKHSVVVLPRPTLVRLPARPPPTRKLQGDDLKPVSSKRVPRLGPEVTRPVLGEAMEKARHAERAPERIAGDGAYADLVNYARQPGRESVGAQLEHDLRVVLGVPRSGPECTVGLGKVLRINPNIVRRLWLYRVGGHLVQNALVVETEFVRGHSAIVVDIHDVELGG
mmetsp:Transcript_106213/g.298649  ORF Transcript_106213/g.298649 Transcript_106213/m.298649 type:complete len:209 (+) Transcript_106213:2355-2981(+)